MEHRALVAVALVAGSVAAAGAGGYLAVRQMAGPANGASAAEVLAVSTEAPNVSGTEAEILPPSLDPSTDPDAAPTPRGAAAPPPPSAARPAAPRPSRPTTTVPPAAAQPPASQAIPGTRPSAAPAAPRAEPRPAPPAPAVPSDPDEGWSSSAARTTHATPSERRDDTWPEPAGDVDATLPSQAPVVSTAPAPSPVRRLESVTIPADSVIGVQLENTVSTQTARVEDPVRARVTRDVRVGGAVVAPAGSRLVGSVTLVEEGGKIRDRARLGVRFHTLVLADGTQVRLPTETIYRDGESPSGRSAAKIGGAAAGGAIIGAILGGGKGALIGAATGAGSGTAVAMTGDRRPAELRAGQPVTVRVTENVPTEIER